MLRNWLAWYSDLESLCCSSSSSFALPQCNIRSRGFFVYLGVSLRLRWNRTQSTFDAILNWSARDDQIIWFYSLRLDFFMAARTMVAGASLGLLQALFQSAEGLERAMPTQTVFADDHADILGWTPKPTNLPVMGRMRRRDEPIPSGTCGYVSESECEIRGK